MFWCIVYQNKMNKILASMFLPLLLMLLEVIIHVNSVKVTSYRGLRKIKNGPVMCAVDQPNQTTLSSSLNECSLSCARDGTCIGFNIRNSFICDMYNVKPKVASLIPDCTFLQVAIILKLNFLT